MPQSSSPSVADLLRALRHCFGTQFELLPEQSTSSSESGVIIFQSSGKMKIIVNVSKLDFP